VAAQGGPAQPQDLRRPARQHSGLRRGRLARLRAGRARHP
jgi:hypothetical protein